MVEPSPSRTPGASETNSSNPRAELMREVVSLNTQLTDTTSDAQALLPSQIQEITRKVRVDNLLYRENPYENDAFFDLSGCENYISAYGGKENLIRTFLYYNWTFDTDSDDGLTLAMFRGETKFNLLQGIIRYNAEAQTENESMLSSTSVPGVGPNEKIELPPSSYFNSKRDSIANFTIRDTGDAVQAGNQNIGFDLEDIYNETVGDLEIGNTDGGQFISLNSEHGARFLEYLVLSLQSLDDIHRIVPFINHDGVKHLVKLGDDGEIVGVHEFNSYFTISDIEWGQPNDTIKQAYETHLTRGSRHEKVIDIQRYITDNNSEAQAQRSRQELEQPEYTLNEDGEVQVRTEQGTSQNASSQESQAPRAFTTSQIRERITILNRLDKQNPSRILSALSFLGMRRDLLIGAMAMDTQVPNNELEISLTRALAAAFTVILRRSTLPSFLTDGASSSNEGSNQAVIAPETRMASRPEVLSLNTNDNQNRIHRKRKTNFQIPESGITLAANQAIYLAPGTQVTIQKDSTMQFFTTVNGGEGNRLGDTHIQSADTEDGTVLTVQKPCLILRESIEDGTIAHNVKITGHAQYSLKEKFTNFNFN